MLSDVWRWQRRGGFGASDEDSLPHVQALQALQVSTYAAAGRQHARWRAARRRPALLRRAPRGAARRACELVHASRPARRAAQRVAQRRCSPASSAHPWTLMNQHPLLVLYTSSSYITPWQGIDLTGTFVQEAQGGERVTSSLLDSLPMSDAEKTEMSGVVQK